MSTIGPLVEFDVFATYKRQQTMLERQKWVIVYENSVGGI